MRRAKVWGYDARNMMLKLLSFHAVPRIENLHPLDGGYFRRKYRRDRRPGMRIESAVAFYPRYFFEIISKHARFARMFVQHWRIVRRVERDSAPYTDLASTPVRDSEYQEMQIYTATPSAKFAVEKLRRRKGANSAAAHVDDRPPLREQS